MVLFLLTALLAPLLTLLVAMSAPAPATSLLVARLLVALRGGGSGLGNAGRLGGRLGGARRGFVQDGRVHAVNAAVAVARIRAGRGGRRAVVARCLSRL